jgi:hypothetical protein
MPSAQAWIANSLMSAMLTWRNVFSSSLVSSAYFVPLTVTVTSTTES